MSDARERQKFLQFLRERGHRVTSERLALFDEIFAQHGHIDAEELLGSMKAHSLKISRATVYRNLDLLVECGLARKQRLGRNRFLYEHVHPGQRHDHLVCMGCGRVVEFVSPGIAALQGEICRAHGFSPTQHTLQISGLCNACAERKEVEAAGQPGLPVMAAI
jgi:Fur family ferric uptake transcriptional regulator